MLQRMLLAGEQVFSSNSWYAATTGSAGGDGSIGNPWDFQTALNNPGNVIQPGDTLYLRGGTYIGGFNTSLTGNAASRITIRSYPGEWAVIDCYTHTALNGAIGTGTGPVTFTDTSMFPGDSVTLWIDYGPSTNYQGELLQLQHKSGNTYNQVQRGWNGTPITSHADGAPVIGWTNGVNINGAYSTWRDLEIKCTNPYRVFNFNTSAYANGTAPFRPEGLEIAGDYTTLINCYIHDCEEAVFSNSGIGLEVHGCVFYNGGLIDTVEGHGQTLYFLNDRSSPVKLVRDVISFNSFGSGMKAYSESGDASNVYFDGVISFNNGSPDNFSGNPLGYTNHHREANIFLGTGNTDFSPSGCQVTNCILYDPAEAEDAILGLITIGHGGGTGALSSTGNVVTGNLFMGSQAPFALDGIAGLIFTGNTVFARTTQIGSVTIAAILSPDLPAGAYTWDNNTYYDDNAWYPYTFQYTGYTHGPYKGGDGGNFLKYNEANTGLGQGWKQWTGFDTLSTYSHGAVPTGTQIVIRANEYQPGRANIAIFNWSLASTVNVDVSSILSNGDTYKVMCAEDPLGTPVLTGTYSGGTIAIPMNGTTVAAPVGLGYTPATTRPEFGVFILIRT